MRPRTSRGSPRTPRPPTTGVPRSRAPNPRAGRRRVGSARFPTTCAVAWVHVFRLLAPTEPEHLGGSVNETCWGEVIPWLRERGAERGREGPGDAARARAAQTRQPRSSVPLRGSSQNPGFPPASAFCPGAGLYCAFCSDGKTPRFRYVVVLLFYG